jgi:hypothetical protein
MAGRTRFPRGGHLRMGHAARVTTVHTREATADRGPAASRLSACQRGEIPLPLPGRGHRRDASEGPRLGVRSRPRPASQLMVEAIPQAPLPSCEGQASPCPSGEGGVRGAFLLCSNWVR